jgi:exodeoxyribonuclease VII small subunit
VSDESYSFDQARVRLEDIVTQVRRKDTSLEKSLDLLEEGVKFVNVCTEQIDHTQWRSAVEEVAEDAGTTQAGEGATAEAVATEPAVDAEPAAETTDAVAPDATAEAADAEADANDAADAEQVAADAERETDADPADDAWSDEPQAETGVYDHEADTDAPGDVAGPDADDPDTVAEAG